MENNKLTEIYKKLKLNPYKYDFLDEDAKTILFYFNDKEHAITMLIAMSEYGDNISLSYEKFQQEYKVELKLQ